MVSKNDKIVTIFLSMVIFILFSGTSCDKDKDCPKDSHNEISIKNNSTKIINWQGFLSDSVYYLNGQPNDNTIATNNSYSYNYRTCWEEYFNTVNNGFQYFFIFDNDTVQSIGWQAISGTNRGLLKRIKVDLNYLENNNFTITYP